MTQLDSGGVKGPGEFSTSWDLSFYRKKVTMDVRFGLSVISDNFTSKTTSL